jgi:hypothetical protein
MRAFYPAALTTEAAFTEAAFTEAAFTEAVFAAQHKSRVHGSVQKPRVRNDARQKPG